MRRRSTTLEARATLSAGFGSGSVRRGGRRETLGADGAGFPGAPQLRGGEWPDRTRRARASSPPDLSPAGGGVRPSRPVAAFPCADCLARPGPRLPRPGVRSCAAFASRLPAFPGRAGHSFPFRSPCRPLPLPAFSRPASRTPLRLSPAASAPQLHSCHFSESVVGRGGQRKSRESSPLGCPRVLTFPRRLRLTVIDRKERTYCFDCGPGILGVEWVCPERWMCFCPGHRLILLEAFWGVAGQGWTFVIVFSFLSGALYFREVWGSFFALSL